MWISGTKWIKKTWSVGQRWLEHRVKSKIMETLAYLSIKYIDKFWITQNTPTQKSATAKLAKKKFVMDLSLRDIVTTKITSRLPEK